MPLILPAAAAGGEKCSAVKSALIALVEDADQKRMPRRPVVAIVDEDSSCREIAEVMLAGGGIEIRVFDTAREFLAQVRFKPCDCILINTHLPEMTAPQIQERLREIGVFTPTVFITSEADLAAAAALLAGGAVDVIQKPIDPASLLPKVRQAILADAA